ncbi:MAG TPA: VCBS domain-containing protein [Ktedonobacteraceae bacterium]|nr:VCBS domain-containing protein [Ktedonobacteraceae bacterium]
MRQSNGTDILGVNDPRSGTIGILYVFPEDERASVLAAILTQEKLARQILVVVLPAQNKAFQRPIDFDGLKNMRRTLKAQLVIIAPQSSSPAEFARQRRFTTYASIDDYAQSLRTGPQAIQPQQKRGWPFGRMLQHSHPESLPESQTPSLSVLPAMTIPPNSQPSSTEDIDIAEPLASIPNENDAAAENMQQLPAMQQDAFPHTDDIQQSPDMIAHMDEQLNVDAHDAMGEQEDAPAHDAIEIPDEMFEDSSDTLDDGDEEPDLDTTVPRNGITGQPLEPVAEPQPVILTPHPPRIPRIPQIPPGSRNVQGYPPPVIANAGRTGRLGSISKAVGAISFFGTQLRTTRRRWLFALLIFLLLLIVGGGIYTAFSVFGTEVTATVTITPVRAAMQQTYTIAAVTGVPNIVQSQIEARFLSSTPPTQSATIPASGRGILPATHATGELTFYNSFSSPQTLLANTIVTDTKGIEVVTDSAVVVPGEIPPTSGSATVTAHTINAGSSSNIPDGDFYNVPCCAGGITLSNLSAFTGGRNAQSYSYVEQSDIDSAVQQLSDILSQRAQTGIMGQILPGEQLIGSVSCVPDVTPDHSAGARAANVTVTVTETCSGEVYNQQQARVTAGNLLAVNALKNFGTSYALVGNVTTAIIQAELVNPAGKVAVQVKAGGVWAYQFSNTQKSQLAHLITGKSEKDAVAVLATTAGVHSVSVQVNGGDGSTLPTDTKQITIVVKA